MESSEDVTTDNKSNVMDKKLEVNVGIDEEVIPTHMQKTDGVEKVEDKESRNYQEPHDSAETVDNKTTENVVHVSDVGDGMAVAEALKYIGTVPAATHEELEAYYLNSFYDDDD